MATYGNILLGGIQGFSNGFQAKGTIIPLLINDEKHKSGLSISIL